MQLKIYFEKGKQFLENEIKLHAAMIGAVILFYLTARPGGAESQQIDLPMETAVRLMPQAALWLAGCYAAAYLLIRAADGYRRRRVLFWLLGALGVAAVAGSGVVLGWGVVLVYGVDLVQKRVAKRAGVFLHIPPKSCN